MLNEAVIKYALNIFLLATSIPAGFLLAWLCDDGLIADRKYFYMVLIILLILSVFMLIFYQNFSAILSMAYMAILLSILILRCKK